MLALLSGPHAARTVRVVDGDTIRCDIHVGTLTLGTEILDVWATDKPVRLLGCNAAPSSTVAGAAAKAHMVDRLPVGTVLTLTSVGDYKYGGELVAGMSVEGVDLVAELIAQQWAAPWDGKGPQPLAPWPRTVTP